MTQPVALTPILTLFPARLNAQIILGSHQGRYVVAKMAIPSLDGTEEETMEIVYESETYREAEARVREILKPTGPMLVAA